MERLRGGFRGRSRGAYTARDPDAVGHHRRRDHGLHSSRLEEFAVPKNPAIAYRRIGELKIREKTGTIMLVFRTVEGKFDTMPSAEDRLYEGDTLIVLGSRGQITRLEQLMRGEKIMEEE